MLGVTLAFPTIFTGVSFINIITNLDEYKTRMKLVRKITPQIIWNVFLLSPIIFEILFKNFPIYVIKKSIYEESHEFVMSLILIECVFYINHFTFHKIAWLYKNFHKKHHEIKDVLGIGTFYCSSVEHVFINLFPFLLSHIIYSNSALHCILMMLLGLSNTILKSHTYKKGSHSRHHLNFNTDYGVFGVLDYVCGTS